MQSLVRLAVLSAILIASSAARAQYARPIATAPMVPTHLDAEGQYYRASVGGLRDYVADLRRGEPHVAKQLEGDLRVLRVRRGVGIGTMVVGGAAGLGLVLAGMFKMVGSVNDCHDLPPFSSQEKACEDRKDDKNAQNLQLMWIGAGVLLASEIIGLAVLPYRRALLRFLNKHNSLMPHAPLRLQVGFDPGQRPAYAGLRFALDQRF